MCEFKNKLDKKIVSGYKIAVADAHGHYYSIATGIRYETGKVKIPKTYCKHNMRKECDFVDILNKSSSAHDPKYAGFTAIFENKSAAMKLFRDVFGIENIVLLKMTLTGELYNGTYGNEAVYLGDTIKSIKKVKK